MSAYFKAVGNRQFITNHQEKPRNLDNKNAYKYIQFSPIWFKYFFRILPLFFKDC